jgi:hypothetical protein
MVGLYLRSPIRLHGVVLNCLSTEPTFPFFMIAAKGIPLSILWFTKIIQSPLKWASRNQSTETIKRNFVNQGYSHGHHAIVSHSTIEPKEMLHAIHRSYVILGSWIKRLPITVPVRSKAWTVFGHSNAGIVGSNPTRGMDVCVRVCVVMCR